MTSVSVPSTVTIFNRRFIVSGINKERKPSCTNVRLPLLIHHSAHTPSLFHSRLKTYLFCRSYPHPPPELPSWTISRAFLLSYSVYVFSFPYFFVSMSCVRSGWPSHLLLSDVGLYLPYHIVSYHEKINKSDRFANFMPSGSAVPVVMNGDELAWSSVEIRRLKKPLLLFTLLLWLNGWLSSTQRPWLDEQLQRCCTLEAPKARSTLATMSKQHSTL